MNIQIKVFHIGPQEERTTIRTTKSGKQFDVHNIESTEVLAGLKGNDFRKKKYTYIFNSDITEFHFNNNSTGYVEVKGADNSTEYHDPVYQEYLYNKKYIQTAQMNKNAVVYIDGQKVWTSREPFYLLEYIMNDRQVTRANSVRDDKTAKLRKACEEVGATSEELNRTYLEMEQFVEMYASMYEVTPRTKKLLTITDEFRNTGAGHSASWSVKHNAVRDLDVLADITEVYYNIIALQHLGFEPDHTKYARCPHCGSWYSLSAPHRPGRCRNCETIETREDFMDSVIEFDVEFRDWQYDADDYDSAF